MTLTIDLPSTVTCMVASRAAHAIARRRDATLSLPERVILADAAELLTCIEDALADHEAEGADDILPRCATCGASPIDCGHLPRPHYAAIAARHSAPPRLSGETDAGASRRGAEGAEGGAA